MEEVANIKEQPEGSFDSGSAGAQSDAQGAQNLPSEQKDEGSLYGKFKDAKSLLNAYLNLEAEFTRKSQQLAQLKDLSKNSEALPAPEQNIKSENSGENVVSENREELPMYKRDGWRKKVADFLSANPQAKSQAKAMSEILLKNKEVAKSENCLDLAYTLSLGKCYVEPASLIDDDEFLKKYVVNNSRAQKLIIDNYINSLKTRPTAPATISGEPASLAPAKATKITTFDGARQALEKCLNNRRKNDYII